MNSSQTFGTASHTASVTDQNLNAGSPATKSTVIVVLCPTVNGNQIFRAENNGNVSQTVAQGKALNRLTDLLSMAGDNAGHELMSAAASIDERCKLKDSAAMILRYTVNGSVERLQKTLSEALFKVGEKAANDNTTLASYASRFGVHAIAVSAESNSYAVVTAIRDQLEAFDRNESNFVVAQKASVEQINAPVIDWSATSANVVLEGAALSFVVRSEKTRVNFLINPIKGNNVVSNDQKALSVFSRENQASVTMEEKVAALEALGYDLGAMPDEEIALSYDSERVDFLEGAGVEVNSSDEGETDDAEEGEEESEEGEEEEEEEDEEEFSASETLAEILTNAQLDRAQLKKLVFLAGGKVFTTDTEESLTVKLLELVEEKDYSEFFQFALDANERLGGVDGFADFLHAESVLATDEDEDDEGEEGEEGEDEDDSDEDDSEDEDEDDSGEDEGEDEDDSEEDLSFNAVVEFIELIGGDLNREVIRAIARSESFGLKTYKNEDAAAIFERVVEVLNNNEISPEDFEQLIHDLAQIEVVADAYPEWAEYEVNPTDYTELFAYEGGSLTHEQRVAALEAAGNDLEGMGMVAVLKLFEDYRRENGYGQESEEAEDETYALDSGEGETDDEGEEAGDEESEESEEESEEEESEDENDEAFVSESSENDLGTFLRVRQEQMLLVNFALTDRSTFEDLAEELRDQNGVDYRVPINMNDEAEGSMYLPLTVASDLLSGSAALPFMSDRKTFNVEDYAEKMANTMRGQISALLYEGRLEAGQDPYTSGLVLGDFVEDEDEDLNEDELSSEYLSELVGDHIPMASLYNAHVGVRPVVVDTESTVLNTIVLNIAMPCIWGIGKKKVKDLVISTYNRVLAHIGETDIKVYVGFTLNAGSLVSDENLQSVVRSVGEMASEEIAVHSFTTNDVQRIEESEDLVEAAHSVGTENLPLALLSSGIADAAFANGGDLIVILSPVGDSDDEDDSDSDEDEDEDESEE
ncbi:hypothetical protein HOU08_gp306 [Dickeya phage vB_DsoM_JA29]|uniref:Uncharacterized protein n=1 Tax=Dickeya phage vB_DsoM_JA29 TaxID=2283031 RepID=A0A384ZXR7_9CAUD|nr:hypothetical protein HOU08_gp306 [Dickeya phage vB_DsoM_JA29]AXG67032.1 hypothetical protein JA29_306 [Dickeya phage vB_DsoM_JA29]